MNTINDIFNDLKMDINIIEKKMIKMQQDGTQQMEKHTTLIAKEECKQD